MAVAALSYGIYQAAPIGSEAARVALGLVFAVCGVALVAGRIGGRRLPAVAADLARFSLGARRFSGAPAELARAEPPAPPVRRRASAPLGDSLAAFVQQTARRLRRTRRRARKLANLRHSPRPRTRGERMPFRPRHWFRKRDRRPQRGGRGHRFAPSLLLGGGTALMVAASVVVCSPPMGLAEEGQSEPWTSDEIEFEPPPEIPGRRLYIERLTVTREAATVALRAAVNLELTAQAFGGPDGKTLELTRTHTLGRGAQVSVLVPAARAGALGHLLLAGRVRPGGRALARGRAAATPAAPSLRRALRPESDPADLAPRPTRGQRAFGLQDPARAALLSCSRPRDTSSTRGSPCCRLKSPQSPASCA